MAQKNKQKSSKGKSRKKDVPISNDPWISMRSALLIMGIVSGALAVFVGWNAIQTQGVLMGVAWGLGFGVANWLIFFVAFKFFKWSRGRQ